MNRLIDDGKIEEMTCGSNFAYILTDSRSFSSTEYKVLQSQNKDIFVRCMKLLYNGKIQFYYLTAGYRPLTDLIPALDADRFLAIVSGILSNVVHVKSIGFLPCKNIDLSCEKIFIDVHTCQVRLVYLPVSEGFFPDEASFENQLRTGLIRLISGHTALNSPGTQKLAADLADGRLSLETLAGRMRGGVMVTPQHGTEEENVGGNYSQNGNVHGGGIPIARRMSLTALNAPGKVELSVDKDSYVIGKNPAAADGVVSFNKAISRVHCRIVRNGTRYAVEDLGSANGTYVNRTRIPEGQSVQVRDGDILRLANSDFQVSIRQ